jgi:hypothetical protein
MTTKATMLSAVKERFGDSTNAINSDSFYNNRLAEAIPPSARCESVLALARTAGNSSVSITANTNSARFPPTSAELSPCSTTPTTMPMAQITGKREYRALYPTDDITGPPQHYRFAYPYIQVFPTPEADTTIVLDYAAKPGTFASNSDTPEWPEDWHYMLTEWALAQAYLDDGNLDQYNAHMAVFNAAARRDETRRARSTW